MAESVSLADILKSHHASEMENAHTAMPGKVISYNPADNTVAVQPLVKRPGFTESGETAHEEIASYPQVPVAFPRAGSYVLYLPVTAGSYGTLVFFDIAPGEAFATGQVSAPQDVSRHSGGYCFFIPGAYPFNHPIGDNPGNMYVGVDGDEAQAHFSAGEIKLGKTATEFVALANLVSDELSALRTWLNTHVHTSAAPSSPTTPPTVLKGAFGSVAADVVKAK